MKRIVADTRVRSLMFGDRLVSCAIGRSGACDATEKREGDGRTPLGTWPIRAALLRPGRGLVPPRHIPWRWLRRHDGWSDDPHDAAYNRPVRHPHPFSAERLWRDDSLYDVVLILGHNDTPPTAGEGSAIFLHLREGDSTEGCIAVEREAGVDLLAHLEADAIIDIV